MKNDDVLTLRVLGAAGTVTGSRTLIESGDHRLLVDCGLFQGYKSLRERNRKPFPVPPDTIDAVVITHAHIDHTGYLPALVRQGFSGKIHSTQGTADLAALLLPDSGHLQEEEAGVHRRRKSSKHADPRPLYTEADALATLPHFRPHPFETEVEVVPGVTARFLPAGHIIGAAHIELNVGGRLVHFSGDLGRAADPVMRAPSPLPASDVLVVESTYGDRSHPEVDAEAELGEIVRRVAARGGTVLIPAFAVGRAESLILQLSRLLHRGEIPAIPMYLNSPMAVEAAEIYASHPGELKISADDLERMRGAVRLIRSVDDSIWLNEQTGPQVIISASGMLTGGRVLHHLAAFGPDPKNAIVLSGYQSGGTRGARLQAGERLIRVYGHDVEVRAEVAQLESLSAHADADEILAWLGTAPSAPELTLVNHGEADSADALRLRIERELGWRAHVADHADWIDLRNPMRYLSGGAGA